MSLTKSQKTDSSPEDRLEQLLSDCNRALAALNEAAKTAQRHSSNGRVVIGGTAIIRGALHSLGRAERQFVQACLKALNAAKAEERVNPHSKEDKSYWWTVNATIITQEALEKMLRNEDNRVFTSRNKSNNPYDLESTYRRTLNGPVTVRKVSSPEEEETQSVEEDSMTDLAAENEELRQQLVEADRVNASLRASLRELLADNEKLAKLLE